MHTHIQTWTECDEHVRLASFADVQVEQIEHGCVSDEHAVQ